MRLFLFYNIFSLPQIPPIFSASKCPYLPLPLGCRGGAGRFFDVLPRNPETPLGAFRGF